MTAQQGMISGGTPTVFVSNMERAVRFYTETLGLRLEYRAGDHFAMIDAGGGTKIGLHPPSEKAAKPGTRGSVEIGLNVTVPIQEAVNALTARGVKFHGPVVDDTQVKLAFFSDPDGTPLYLCEVAKW